jgi:tetratricopeptide (TPR) repeat protein
MVRLADIGTAADADALMPRLQDRDPTLRQAALAMIWRLWGRSGDAAIDKLYEQGMGLMQSGNLPRAVAVFSGIISQRPAFAEAWNKRATLYYMLNQYDLSMKDCDEVLKRIPNHFGALSGYAQMLAERDQPERALDMLERAYRVNPNSGNAEPLMDDLRRQIEAKRKKST